MIIAAVIRASSATIAGKASYLAAVLTRLPTFILVPCLAPLQLLGGRARLLLLMLLLLLLTRLPQLQVCNAAAQLAHKVR